MTASEVTTQVDLVLSYYNNIDAGDIPAALACFGSTAVYRRPGYDPLVGRAAIEKFYAATRVVGPGKHQIEAIIESGDEVAVRGRFDGSLQDGSALHARWGDFWRFAEGKVVERNSYFDAPVA
jgi:ketosteroid isomerase-like protein